MNIALGSLAEAKYLLDFSLRLKYLSAEGHRKSVDLAEEVGRLLWKFYKSL
jgi:four helix bundle protein